ncbi:MAG TPA: hypothetical protein VI072_27720 [Polyangiaceae bacterium]
MRNQFGLILGLILAAYANVAAAAEPPFAAPSGFEGAGLGLGDQKGRVWTETAFHTQEYFTVAAATLGAGYRVTDSLELEAMLPFSYVSVEFFDLGGHFSHSERDHGFGIGNPYLGISRVNLDGTLRYKAGLGVTLPIAADEYPAGTAVVLAPATYGWQNAHLWAPDVLSIAAPLRVEGGDTFVLGVDATPIVMISTEDEPYRDSDAEFVLQVAPGAGVYATDALLIGARLPIFWAVTGDSYDNAQVAVEPYARLDVGSGFLNARFTVNLDEPLGFAFDEGKVWGAHLGGGLVF